MKTPVELVLEPTVSIKESAIDGGEIKLESELKKGFSIDNSDSGSYLDAPKVLFARAGESEEEG